MTPDLSHLYGHAATAILGRPSLTMSFAVAVSTASATYPSVTFLRVPLLLVLVRDGMILGMLLTTC